MVYTITVHLLAKPDADSISKLKAKLVEASQVYSKDRETLSWFVMQDVKEERKFTIVERYEKESSQKYHLEVCLFHLFDLGDFREGFGRGSGREEELGSWGNELD